MTKGYFDPETCEKCGEAGRVVDSRRYPGYRRQRYACLSTTCGERWTAYKSRVHPLQALQACEASNETVPPVPTLAPSVPVPSFVAPAEASAATGSTRTLPSRRVARSPYLR